MKENGLSMSRRSFALGSSGVGIAQQFEAGNWLDDGPVQWNKTASDESSTKPIAIVDDLLLLSAGEKLIAVTAGDGAHRWERAIASPLSASDVCRMDRDTICVNDGSDELFALDITSGETAWEFTPDAQVDSLTSGTDGSLYVVAETLYVLSENGETKWSHSSESPFVGSPVAHDDAVFAGTQSGIVFSLSTADGEIRWKHRRPTSVPDVSTVGVTTAGGEPRLLVWERGDRERLVALSATSGEQQWVTEFEGTTQWFMGTITNDTIYLSHDQSLLALSMLDGSTRWMQQTEGDWIGSPVVAEETVFASTEDELYAFAGQSGSERWNQRAEDGLLVVPDVDGLYHYGEGTNVSSLSPTDGTVQWKTDLEATPVGLLSDGGVTYVGTETGTVVALAEQTPTGVSAKIVPSVLLGGSLVLGAAGYVYYRRNGDEG